MSAFRPPGTSNRPLYSSMGRSLNSRTGIPGTATRSTNSEGRPMTSVSGAGYHGMMDHRIFDPLNVGKGQAAPLAEKTENSSEEKAKELEKSVHRLLEASAQAAKNYDYTAALMHAKEAGKNERTLCKFRENHGMVDHINVDLTYSICLNLADAYYHNKMHDDALNAYQLLLKNKQYPHSTRVRVNIGNIYYEQKKYTMATKMYRRALDQVPTSGKELRCKIHRNIGNAFVKLGMYDDAIRNYKSAMEGSIDMQTAFNLLLCLYTFGDKNEIKRHFIKMITIPLFSGSSAEEEEEAEDIFEKPLSVDFGDNNIYCEEVKKRKEYRDEKLLQAARLIAPIIDDSDDWVAGYKWVIEQVKQENESVSSKLEIDLAMTLMRKGDFEESISVLKSFEKKDSVLKSMAAINLSFIYFLEGDYMQAEKHADLAIVHDRYNAKGLVNKANCLYLAGEYSRAKELYLEAVGVEADCVEAIFNLGLVNLRLNSYNEAHGAFDKLQTILPNIPEALYNIGSIYDKSNDKNDLEQAAKTFEMLLSKISSDAHLCSKIAQIYEKLEDENTACHWQSESFRKYPSSLAVISWLGVWYVKREMYDQAIEYFECAAKVQPSEVKWRLMVASCHRRLGDLHKSLDIYKQLLKLQRQLSKDNLSPVADIIAERESADREEAVKYEQSIVDIDNKIAASDEFLQSTEVKAMLATLSAREAQKSPVRNTSANHGGIPVTNHRWIDSEQDVRKKNFDQNQDARHNQRHEENSNVRITSDRNENYRGNRSFKDIRTNRNIVDNRSGREDISRNTRKPNNDGSSKRTRDVNDLFEEYTSRNKERAANRPRVLAQY
ncbi:unnamed protein product [Sphagnum jensenii]|uniref:Uncharacterized protein n=1 Tax=Sphagnum jensenii TaxID=128206 RepID=A0ABP0VEE9_9BRYO